MYLTTFKLAVSREQRGIKYFFKIGQKKNISSHLSRKIEQLLICVMFSTENRVSGFDSLQDIASRLNRNSIINGALVELVKMMYPTKKGGETFFCC